jgi:hypothetical protein
MKRCPKCNRTYTTDNQKYCTQDGGVLEAVEANQSDTIRIDSSQLKQTVPEARDDAATRAISRELIPETPAEFDPFKTVMARPGGTTGVSGRDTGDLATPSAPLTPAPTSASLPPLPDSGTLPSLPPTPMAPPPATPEHRQTSGSLQDEDFEKTLYTGRPAPHSQPVAAPRPAKKSRLPLLLGLLALLFVLGVGGIAAAYFVVWPILVKRTVSPPEPQPEPSIDAPRRTEPTPALDDRNATNEPPPYSPPSNAVEFVNSKDNLDGKLAEHYTDFSFYYPRGWQKDPAAGRPGARNFAQVERRLPPSYTLENFAVGWYSSAGSADADRTVFPRLAENLSSQFAKSIGDYRKVSEGQTKVGPYNGYEFRFEGLSQQTDKGQFKIWGRAIFLSPVDGSKNGVTLLMLATSLAPELKRVDDVGVKGELPMLLESFRFGKK